jgi:hypothetical protein
MLLAIWVSSDESSKSPSNIVHDETEEWGKSPILDMKTTSDSSCPSGYQ